MKHGTRFVPVAFLILVQMVLSLPVYAAPSDLDQSFSGNGWNRTLEVGGQPTDSFFPVVDVLVQQDGGVLVAGTADLQDEPTGWAFALARYTPSGAFDTEFGGPGGGSVAWIDGREFAAGAALQSDGKIVVTGEGECEDVLSTCFATARFTVNGQLDPTFGGNGWVTTQFPGPGDAAQDVTVMPNGKIVVVGYRRKYGDSNDDLQFGIVRYRPDGQLDTSFSHNGKLIVDFGYGNAIPEVVILQPDGKVLVGGSADGMVLGGWSDFALVRLRHDGTLDPSFSGDGKKTTNFGGLSSESIQGLWLRSDGRIIAAGSTSKDGTWKPRIAVARYSSGGNLDHGFANGGLRATAIGPHGTWGEDVVVIGGRILVGGGSYRDPAQEEADFALIRYTSAGSLDPTFSGDGKARYHLISGWNWVEGLAPYGSQKVVGAGPLGGAFGVARWLM